jgi:hypothetical protein
VLTKADIRAHFPYGVVPGGFGLDAALAREVRSVSYGTASGTVLVAYPDGSVCALGGKVDSITFKGGIVRQVTSPKPWLIDEGEGFYTRRLPKRPKK